MSTFTPENIIRSMATAISDCRHYEDCDGKFLLWATLVAMILPVDEFHQIACGQDFLSMPVHMFQTEDGLLLFTHYSGQVNLNVVVPVTAASCTRFITTALAFVTGAFEGYAINMAPLATHVPRWAYQTIELRKRRFLMDRSQIPDMVYDAQRRKVTLLNMTISIVRVIESRTDVIKYTPLTRMQPGDPLSTIYWFKAPCGTLVAMGNPVVAFLKPPELPPLVGVAGLMVCRTVDARIDTFLCALSPNDLSQCLAAMCESWVPMRMRCLLVETTVAAFGIHDELIVHVGKLFADEYTSLIQVMMHMHTIMQLADHPGSSEVHMCDVLTRTLLEADEQAHWTQWATTSAFVHAFIASLTATGLCRMCARHDVFRHVGSKVLHGRMGAWAPSDVAKAAVITKHGEDGKITAELARLRDAADFQASAVLAETVGVPARRQRSSRERRERRNHKATCGSSSAAPPQTSAHGASKVPQEQTATHETLARRLEELCGYPCELIGSGVFSDASDADVVITVADAPSLAAAYERVACDGLLVPAYEEVTGQHVAVLRGTFEGVDVDAQVWRGDAASDTRAEEETRKALRLARRVHSHLDDEGHECVRTFHRWMHAADLKGHQMCRMPGVAVTCTAIVLGCRNAQARVQGVRPAIAALRDALSTDTPCIDFDQLSTSPSTQDAAHCSLALVVLVDEVNVTTRMTRSTTRHLLACLHFAMNSPRNTALDDAVHYEQWRRATMLSCVRMRPTSARSISHTLHAVATRLDGHPLVDTLHFSDEEGGLVNVRVTLRPDADASKYGFRDGDDVEVDGARARIVRDGRTWHLAAVVSRSLRKVVPWGERAHVGDLLPLTDYVAIPNAPYLTVDAVACFDPAWWEVGA